MKVHSQTIKLLRIQSGKTQVQMAKFLGVTERTYQRYEADGAPVAVKIAMETKVRRVI